MANETLTVDEFAKACGDAWMEAAANRYAPSDPALRKLNVTVERPDDYYDSVGMAKWLTAKKRQSNG